MYILNVKIKKNGYQRLGDNKLKYCVFLYPLHSGAALWCKTNWYTYIFKLHLFQKPYYGKSWNEWKYCCIIILLIPDQKVNFYLQHPMIVGFFSPLFSQEHLYSIIYTWNPSLSLDFISIIFQSMPFIFVMLY